jgi:hypothetical protein
MSSILPNRFSMSRRQQLLGFLDDAQDIGDSATRKNGCYPAHSQCALKVRILLTELVKLTLKQLD